MLSSVSILGSQPLCYLHDIQAYSSGEFSSNLDATAMIHMHACNVLHTTYVTELLLLVCCISLVCCLPINDAYLCWSTQHSLGAKDTLAQLCKPVVLDMQPGCDICHHMLVQYNRVVGMRTCVLVTLSYEAAPLPQHTAIKTF